MLAPLVFLAPLAGVLSLYAAAAINSNSALVTLAVLNTRRKRSVASSAAEEEVDTLANFLFGHHQNNVTTGLPQRDEIISKYLSCSDSSETECLKSIACDAFSPYSKVPAGNSIKSN